jgi:hypothetical protein
MANPSKRTGTEVCIKLAEPERTITAWEKYTAGGKTAKWILYSINEYVITHILEKMT